MVNVFPDTEEVTPAGKPVTVAPVAPPFSVYVIGVIAVFTHTVWVSVAATEANAIA